MQKTKIAISLGSNLGDREKFLKAAFDLLVQEFLEDAVSSSIYESEPWGITDQPRFLNSIVTGFSEWKPPALVNFFKRAEAQIGKRSLMKYGPREIDIDLIAYGNELWSSEGVEVPHPHFRERSFVVAPLAEVWPDWKDPKTQISARNLWEELSKKTPSGTIAIVFPPPSKATQSQE
jgi:2-amino-4-hydroxy-6-hydroxymethyldihydropteridine diphosphokinase